MIREETPTKNPRSSGSSRAQSAADTPLPEYEQEWLDNCLARISIDIEIGKEAIRLFSESELRLEL